MINCPNCGRDNDDSEKICVFCGYPLVDLKGQTSTRAFEDTDYEEGDPKWGAARFKPDTLLRLDVQDSGQHFVYDYVQAKKLVIGRKNPDTGIIPDVDLSASNALESGVSRHHANIELRDDALYIIDNNSANGTFLNGQKLVAGQPRILRDGDDVRLGHLVLRITFLRQN